MTPLHVAFTDLEALSRHHVAIADAIDALAAVAGSDVEPDGWESTMAIVRLEGRLSAALRRLGSSHWELAASVNRAHDRYLALESW